MFEFRSGGRRVGQNEFFENLKNSAIEAGMKQLEEKIHAAAAAIIDPETGKHAEVFVRRTGDTTLSRARRVLLPSRENWKNAFPWKRGRSR
jgi:hypothetical protein